MAALFSREVIGAVAGGAAAGGGTIGANYLLPAEQKKWASVIGLGAALLAAGGFAAAKKWRGAAVHAALTGVLVAGPRALEVFPHGRA